MALSLTKLTPANVSGPASRPIINDGLSAIETLDALRITADGKVTALEGRVIGVAGLATGGGNLTADRVVNVPAATTTSVNDRLNAAAAVTPVALEAKVVNDLGHNITHEEFRHVYAVDENDRVIDAMRYDGSRLLSTSQVVTDATFQYAFTDRFGKVLYGKTWSGPWAFGPFKNESLHLLDARLAITSAGNLVLLRDGGKVIQLTFGEVAPIAPEIQLGEAFYRVLNGLTFTEIREDLVARNTLVAGITKLKYRIFYGQSNSIGGASTPAITTTAYAPGRVVMWNGGTRPLATSQNSDYFTTPLPRANIVQLVDAFETTISVGGESPCAGFATRLLAGLPSTEAILVGAHGIGGANYTQIKKGTVPYNNMMAGVRRYAIICQLLGIQPEIEMHFIHGEANRTDASGVYKARLVEIQGDITTEVQAVVPGHGQVVLYVSQLTNYTAPDYNIPFSYVPNDQFEAARDNPTKIQLVGSTYHLPTGGDGIHRPPAASYALGDMHAGGEARFKATQPSCLKALTAVRAGATITIACEVPTAPLVRDTTLVTDPGADVGAIAGLKYGFRYVQTGGTARTVSDVTASGTTITVTLSGDPGSPSAESLNIGLDGVAGNNGGSTSGVRICIRDSATGTDVNSTPRYNWMTQRNLPVTV